MVSTWVVARAAIVTVVMGWVFLDSARGEAYFQDGFGTFNGWTYTSGSTGTFGASGYLYLSTGQASAGSTAAQKLLDVSLSATNDFTFTVRLASGADTSGTCGTFSAKLIDATNTVVALIDWHDVQTSTGYGGVDFYGQNQTAIYRTDPSGFGREYGVFPATGDYGSLMLMRSGCEWSAWVNGMQKGPTLTLAPTLTATKIEIEMGHWQLWSERDLAVDNIGVTPKPTTLDDMHQLGITGQGVKIGILDWYAVDPSCPLFDNRLTPPQSFGLPWPPLSAEDLYHATKMAAIAAGKNSSYTGVAPKAEILSNAISPVLQDINFKAAVHSGPQSLVQQGADVVSISIGPEQNVQPPDGNHSWDEVVDHVVDQHGLTVVIAAGNISDSHYLAIPAAAFNGITVGGAGVVLDANLTPQNWNTLWNGVSTPGTLDGRCKPDIIAPAEAVAVPQLSGVVWTTDGWGAGTSVAAPQVAGAAALLVQLAKEQPVPDLCKDPRVIKAVLLTSADKLSGSDFRWTHSPTRPLDRNQGAGLLNVIAAYELYAPGPQPGGVGLWTVPESGWDRAGVNPNGGVQEYVIGSVLAPGDKLISTLVWNRHVDDTYNDSLLTNLSLLLCKHGSGAGVDYSNSAVDNVEHVVYTVPYGQGGQYELRVVNGGSGVTEDYGLAWRVIRQGVDLPRTMASNGDFAAGDLTGWHVTGSVSAVLETEGYGDYWAARLVGDGSGVDQTVQIEAQRLTLEFDYRFDGTGSDLVALLGGVQVGSPLEHDSEWHRAFFDIDASSWVGGTAPLAFRYSTSDPDSGVFIDGISLTPEPATLSLLILGGLAVMAQRRWRK